MDEQHLDLMRENVRRVIRAVEKDLDLPGNLVLDIAPQDHLGAAEFFRKATLETLDIDPSSGATYIADLCCENFDRIPDGRFDLIFCTEVLEHVAEPFAAVRELYRMLKPGGNLVVTTPFNFRIHGPLPDCWRFTVHGLRLLFKSFRNVEVQALECPGRFLMPIQYTVRAVK